MPDGQLPQPVTREDVYLHDMATSLRTLSGRNVHPIHGDVELREPATDDRLTCACGRECKSAAGLAKHRAACEAA